MPEITYIYPEAGELREIERDRALTLQRDSVIGRLFPFGAQAGAAVNWDQRDSVVGLLPAKRLGDPLQPLQMTGGIRRSVPASYFGGQIPIDVRKIVAGGRFGSYGDRIDLASELNIGMQELAYRERQGIDLQIGRMISTGLINVYAADGTIQEQYAIEGFGERRETLTGGDRWTEIATADPIGDFRRVADNRFRGTGYSMVGGSVLMTQKAFNILLNTNAVKATLRQRFGASVVNLADFNSLFGDTLGTVEIVTMGANISNTAWLPYLADNVAVFVGRHATRGTQLGEWVITTSEKAGVGEAIHAEVVVPQPYPSAPIVERAIQGAPMLMAEKQVAVLTFASEADVNNYAY